jgi:hypothetical protein
MLSLHLPNSFYRHQKNVSVHLIDGKDTRHLDAPLLAHLHRHVRMEEMTSSVIASTKPNPQNMSLRSVSYSAEPKSVTSGTLVTKRDRRPSAINTDILPQSSEVMVKPYLYHVLHVQVHWPFWCPDSLLSPCSPTFRDTDCSCDDGIELRLSSTESKKCRISFSALDDISWQPHLHQSFQKGTLIVSTPGESEAWKLELMRNQEHYYINTIYFLRQNK